MEDFDNKEKTGMVLKDLYAEIEKIDTLLTKAKAMAHIDKCISQEKVYMTSKYQRNKVFTSKSLYECFNAKEKDEFCDLQLQLYDDPSSGESSDEETFNFNPSVQKVIETIYIESQFKEIKELEEVCNDDSCANFKLNDLTNSNDLLELPLCMKCKLMPDAHIMLSNIDDNIDATYLSSVMEAFIK